MKTLRLFAVLLLALNVTAALAHGPGEHKEKIHVKLASEAGMLDLDLSGMEVGDTRKEKTEDGKEVVITRQKDGFKIDVDGKEIHVDAPGDHFKLMQLGGEGHGAAKVMVMAGDGNEHDVLLRKMGGGEMHKVIVTGEDGEEQNVHVVRMGHGGGHGSCGGHGGGCCCCGGGHGGHAAHGGGGHAAHGGGGHAAHGGGGHAAHGGGGHAMTWTTTDGEFHEVDEDVFFFKGEGAAEKLVESGVLDGLDEEKRQAILDALKSDDEEKKIVVKVRAEKKEDDK